jgi:hypothetical protein
MHDAYHNSLDACISLCMADHWRKQDYSSMSTFAECDGSPDPPSPFLPIKDCREIIKQDVVLLFLVQWLDYTMGIVLPLP